MGKMHKATDNYEEGATVRLAHNALHALKWRYTGITFQVGLQFIAGVILARLLSPEVFGLVRMSLMVVEFGKFVGLSFGTAIIQRPHLTREHVRTAFTGSLIVGLLLFSVLWFLAPMISHLFMQAALTPIVRIMGISFILLGTSTTLVYMLRRELQFRTLALIETTSYMVGFGIVGIPLAILGYGVWSLVAVYIVQPLCLLILALYVLKLPLWPYFHLQKYRDLSRLVSAEFFNSLTTYIAENLDFFIAGKWLGVSALGLYNRAFSLAILPGSLFSQALATVMFPLYSKIQGDVPRLRRAYLLTLSLTTIVTIPVLFAMAAAPEVVIGGLFGQKWKAAAGAFQILCLSGPFWAIVYVFGALSHARGYVFSEWRRQMIYLIVMGLAVWSLIPLGIQGVALAVALAIFIRYLLLAQLAVKLVKIRWSDFFLAQIPGCLLGIIVFAMVYLASNLGEMFKIPDVLHLLIIVTVSILTLLISLFLLPSSWFGDLYPWLNEQFGMNFPCWLQRIMVAKLRKNVRNCKMAE